MHGYAIAGRATELSDGRVKVSAGTLYGALDRLTAAGTIEIDREEQVDGRRRRYYRITGQGRAELADEVVRMQGAIAAHSATVTSAAVRVVRPVGLFGVQ